MKFVLIMWIVLLNGNTIYLEEKFPDFEACELAKARYTQIAERSKAKVTEKSGCYGEYIRPE